MKTLIMQESLGDMRMEESLRSGLGLMMTRLIGAQRLAGKTGQSIVELVEDGKGLQGIVIQKGDIAQIGTFQGAEDIVLAQDGILYRVPLQEGSREGLSRRRFVLEDWEKKTAIHGTDNAYKEYATAAIKKTDELLEDMKIAGYYISGTAWGE